MFVCCSSPPMYGGYSQQQMMSPGPRFRAQMNTSLGSPSPFFNNMNRSSGSGTPDSFLGTPSTGSERSGGRGGRFGHKVYISRHKASILNSFEIEKEDRILQNLHNILVEPSQLAFLVAHHCEAVNLLL